jgi:hypothetical protein
VPKLTIWVPATNVTSARAEWSIGRTDDLQMEFPRLSLGPASWSAVFRSLETRNNGSTLCERRFLADIYDTFRVIAPLAMK